MGYVASSPFDNAMAEAHAQVLALASEKLAGHGRGPSSEEQRDFQVGTFYARVRAHRQEADRLEGERARFASELSEQVTDFSAKLATVQAQEWHAINDRRELLTFWLMTETQRPVTERRLAELSRVMDQRLKVCPGYYGTQR